MTCSTPIWRGLFLCFASLFFSFSKAYANSEPCWEVASQRYRVPVALLKAVAEVESSNRARVVARNTNGSLDIGFMQINDWWLPQLKQHGIQYEHLMDACVNLNVGAWILRQGIDRYGYNWQGIGAYGAGTDPNKDNVRLIYANKVFRALAKQRRQGTSSASLINAGYISDGARLQRAVYSSDEFNDTNDNDANSLSAKYYALDHARSTRTRHQLPSSGLPIQPPSDNGTTVSDTDGRNTNHDNGIGNGDEQLVWSIFDGNS